MRWWVRKQFLRLKLYIIENYQNESESLIIWYAVCYALGAAFYLAFPWELSIWTLIFYFEAILLLLYLYRNQKFFKLLTYATTFMLGIMIAKANTLYTTNKIEMQMPEVSYLYGYIEEIDRNTAGNIRLTISHADNFERKLKGQFRISTRQEKDWLKKGTCIEMVANFPKHYEQNPLGNYNHKRTQFYQEISATGYTISPIFEAKCIYKSSTIKDKINKLRQKIENIIDNNTTKEQGGIIKALTIGNKKSITTEQNTNYRTSGLAHILAISGMHMGMIAILVFFLVQILILPFSHGQYDLRKPAALISLLLTFLYFLISGQSTSCIRAFTMTSLILLAILFNRRAISLRLWAFAVIVVVSITPAATLSPGFLMSFSATLGLISFYNKKSTQIKSWYASQTHWKRINSYFITIIITDTIASLMTLPYSLYYFHQISIYTTLGNFLAGPIIAFWIMPMILLFLLCLPLGISPYTLKPLGWGIDTLNDITQWVSALPGAHTGENLTQLPDTGILLITLGILWLCIWQQKWRYWGIISIILGFYTFITAPKADFVFDKGGQTFACRTNDNRLIPTPWHNNKFFTYIWTGQHPSKEKIKNTTDTLTCQKQICTCQKRIKFKRHQVELDNKIIPLHHGGFIDLNKGIFYQYSHQNRPWD